MVACAAQSWHRLDGVGLLRRHPDDQRQTRRLVDRNAGKLDELINEFNGHVVDDEPTEVFEGVSCLRAPGPGQAGDEQKFCHGVRLLRRVKTLMYGVGNLGRQPRQLPQTFA